MYAHKVHIAQRSHFAACPVYGAFISMVTRMHCFNGISAARVVCAGPYNSCYMAAFPAVSMGKNSINNEVTRKSDAATKRGAFVVRSP